MADKRTIDELRILGFLGFVVALVAYVYFFGLPKQSVEVVGWVWLATIAWDVRRPVGDHMAFLRDWWPPFVVLTLYLYSRGLSDDLGIFSVHFTEPIKADEWLFGGHLPTTYLQEHLCGVPCEKSLPPRWYDVVLTTVYYSHFFAAIGIAAYLWRRNRPDWIRYMRRYLSVISIGVVCYVVYPMAPPWMASRDGYISTDIERITGRGWFDLGSSHGHATAQQHISAVGNQVAAMPSLHVALSVLVAWWTIGRLRTGWRWLLVLYPLAMAFMLVYYGEHYVVDGIAGLLLVAGVMAAWKAVEGRRETESEGEEPTALESAGQAR